MSGMLWNMANAQDEGPNFQPASFQSNTSLQASQAVPPSPQAASLGRFGNVSVNYYSGSPGIEVPVYSLSGQTLINQYGIKNLLNIRNSIAPKYWPKHGIPK